VDTYHPSILFPQAFKFTAKFRKLDIFYLENIAVNNAVKAVRSNSAR